MTGRVVFADGRPAAGAAVATSHAPAWVLTGEDGRFDVESGVVRHAIPCWVVLPGFAERPHAPVTVRANESVDAGDVVLDADPWVTVRGRVVPLSGADVGRSTVRLRAESAGAFADAHGTVTSPLARAMFPEEWVAGWVRPGAESVVAPLRDPAAAVAADGTFELRLPSSYGAVRLVVRGAGHLEATSEVVDLASGAPAVEIEVAPLPRVDALVVDAATSEPLAGAEVSIGDAKAVSDAQGHVAVAAPPHAAPNAQVRRDGYLPRTVDLRRGAPPRIALRRDLRIAGRLVDRDGAPLARVSWRVVGAPPPAEEGNSHGVGALGGTRPDGTFAIGWVPDGTYELVFGDATMGGAQDVVTTRVRDVRAGTMDLVVVAERSALALEVRLVDADGAPVGGVSVRAAQGEHPAASAGTWDGRVVLRGLRPGPCVVSWAGSMRWPSSFRAFAPVEVPAGAREVTIVVPRALGISGRILDASGRPVVGAGLAYLPADEPPSGPAKLAWCRTGQDGTFELLGLEPGEWRLVSDAVDASGARLLWLSGGERVAAGATGVVLTQALAARISGVVVDETGAAVADAEVVVPWDAADAAGRRTRTDARGRFSVGGLAPGRSYAVVMGAARVEDVAAGARDVRVVKARR